MRATYKYKQNIYIYTYLVYIYGIGVMFQDIPLPDYTVDQVQRFINIFKTVSIIVIVLIILNLILSILKSIHIVLRNVNYWRTRNNNTLQLHTSQEFLNE